MSGYNTFDPEVHADAMTFIDEACTNNVTPCDHRRKSTDNTCMHYPEFDISLSDDPWNEWGDGLDWRAWQKDYDSLKLAGINAMIRRLTNLERRLALREWRKEMKSASRTCWNTGQPYIGLGAFLSYRQREIAE